ncbi:MAG: GtrA family protein [Alphaproteobacteria bacterium]|nr:GtrA family protein [Alphaproteobacteria bacterium]
MIKLYRQLEGYWFSLPEKIRFILVGGFNTVVSYFLFLGLNWLWGYKTALWLTYAIAVNLSIFTMRYYVFSSRGNLLEQYIKALSTYVVTIIGNFAFLHWAVEAGLWPVWLAQALYTAISTLGLYLLHKYVNFKA